MPMATLADLYHQFLLDLENTSWLEFIAVITGILSVWLSRIENIWVYPTGLVNTIIYIWLSFKSSLLGEASVNFYYTVVSIYGWILWARKDEQQQHILQDCLLHPPGMAAATGLFWNLLYRGLFCPNLPEKGFRSRWPFPGQMPSPPRRPIRVCG